MQNQSIVFLFLCSLCSPMRLTFFHSSLGPAFPSISAIASHLLLAISAISSQLLSSSLLLCVLQGRCMSSLLIFPSDCLSLLAFLCLSVCLVDSDEAVIHDLLQVFLSEDIRSSTTCTHPHTCRHTRLRTHGV